MSQSRIRDLLRRWIENRAPEEGVQWLTEKRDEIAAGAPSRVFYTSFSAVPRYLGKTDLELSASEQERADEVRTGWQPASWSVDQAGRILLALSLPHDDSDDYRAELDRVFEHGDVGESVALCLALPLLPHPEAHRERAAEGVRSNMTAVLAAVALRNPYPAEQFDDPAWNQMVLKAAFEGLPFREIYGLDDRANPTLARMLVDYAHERWAADRPVSPDLWRPVGPFAEGEAVDDLARVLADGTPAERMAAALALHDSPDERSEEILAEHEDLRRRVAEGGLTWDDVAEEHATA
ncbi:MAG: EboA domain-containing protein [Salinibacter sp.]